MKSPTNDNATALAKLQMSSQLQTFKVPFLPPPRKKKKVLTEEEYIKKLSKIIERDYFPDLDNLKDKLEYIEAKESNDFSKLREIYAKYSSGGSASQSRIEDSPATFETPEHIINTDQDASASTSDQMGDNKKTDSDNEKLPSLDSFMSNYTSEDNENFEQLMEDTRHKLRMKNPWLYGAESKHNERYAPDLTLPSIEEQAVRKTLAITGTASKEKDIRPTQVENWKYTTFNSVMYSPDGVVTSTNNLNNDKMKKKEVVYSNTRFDGNPFNETVSQATMMEASAIQASKKEGKVGIDGKELSKETPLVNGYSFVPNPSPIPGVDSTPLMTWGEVEGTPFQLDGSQTPLIKGHSTPAYKMPKVPDKDQLVLKLVEKANQNHKDKKNRALSAARSYLGTPVSKFGKQSSMDRLSCMSPAAQKLLKSKVRHGTDRSLRASYTPLAGSSRSKFNSTPGAITPKTARDNLSSKIISQSPGITTGLTDNLLQLPRKTSKQEQEQEKPVPKQWCRASDFF